ncbi:hypothetical protein KDW_62440 [Dictyobacter vulcani]|uniref:Uncharacterized protein n=1 Tax=Dictyobacter vulcani TaxID=2607529 RepID=A0A5J4KYD2_9CHLR|nr:hypothetical protein KDW_62440 [Dictyobacter vulcani]
MSQYSHVSPTSFFLDEEQRVLYLSWDDEHESKHDWERLRWPVPVPGVPAKVVSRACWPARRA